MWQIHIITMSEYEGKISTGNRRVKKYLRFGADEESVNNSYKVMSFSKEGIFYQGILYMLM